MEDKLIDLTKIEREVNVENKGVNSQTQECTSKLKGKISELKSASLLSQSATM